MEPPKSPSSPRSPRPTLFNSLSNSLSSFVSDYMTPTKPAQQSLVDKAGRTKGKKTGASVWYKV